MPLCQNRLLEERVALLEERLAQRGGALSPRVEESLGPNQAEGCAESMQPQNLTAIANNTYVYSETHLKLDLSQSRRGCLMLKLHRHLMVSIRFVLDIVGIFLFVCTNLPGWMHMFPDFSFNFAHNRCRLWK